MDAPSSNALLGRVANALGANGELGIGFGKSRGVKDSANAVLATTLAQTETSGRRMSNNVTSNRLRGIWRRNDMLV
jgi:hypothetical protein